MLLVFKVLREMADVLLALLQCLFLYPGGSWKWVLFPLVSVCVWSSCSRGPHVTTCCLMVPTFAVWACGSLCMALISHSMDKVAFITGLVVGTWWNMVNIKFAWLKASVVHAASAWHGPCHIFSFGFHCSWGFQGFLIVGWRSFIYFPLFNKVFHVSFVVYPALYEENTDMHLNVYLLVCVNEVLFTMSMHAYIYNCDAPYSLFTWWWFIMILVQ